MLLLIVLKNKGKFSDPDRMKFVTKSKAVSYAQTHKLSTKIIKWGELPVSFAGNY